MVSVTVQFTLKVLSERSAGSLTMRHRGIKSGPFFLRIVGRAVEEDTELHLMSRRVALTDHDHRSVSSSFSYKNKAEQTVSCPKIAETYTEKTGHERIALVQYRMPALL